MISKNSYRERPTTFGIPKPKEEVHWNWEGAILDSVGADLWMADKFIGKLKEHKRKFPAFIPERVASIFIDAPAKYKAFYCYRPIKEFTKSIHKAASLRSQAMGQS